MKKIILMALALLMIVSVNAWSQDISRVGTAAGQFLKIGVGARAAALGEAGVTFDGDIASLYWNPSAIASIDRVSLMVSHTSLYADISHNFLGVVAPLGGGSAIGLGIVYLNSGDIEITTFSIPDGTGTHYTVQDYSVGISYGRYVTDRLRLGATVKYIQEGIYREKAHMFAVDLASLLDTGVLGIKLGMCLSNFGGSMRLDGPDLRVSHDPYPDNQGNISSEAHLRAEKWPLPMVYRMGISTDLVGTDGQLMASEINRLTIAADAFDSNDALLRSNLGIEYEWNNTLALRGGYHGATLTRDEFDTYDTASYTFGAGLRYDLRWTEFQFDYAFTNYGILGNTHQFTLGMQF